MVNRRCTHSIGGNSPEYAQKFKDVKQTEMRPDSQLISLPSCPVPRREAVAPVSTLVEETRLEAQRLITHLQNAAELKETALAHQLHDDLGGLMGAAVMDLDSMRRVKPALSQNALERLDRVKRTLEQAIDLKRRVIEDLRPSILDNFGLFAALRWQLKKTWGNSAVVCSETYPDVEPVFESGAAIVLFRIAQEALSIALLRVSLKSTDLSVRVDPANFWMRFSDDGTSHAEKQSEETATILSSMRHRIRALGGTVEISKNETNATAMTIWMPLLQVSTAVGN
jgi:signal transduction histidine kinase